MSRAFVKEVDDAPPPPPFERPVSGAPNLVTPRGARLIEETVAELERAVGEAAGEAEAALRRDLRYWLARRATARVVPTDDFPKAVGFGTGVTIRRGGRESRIRIVGEDEADPDAGLIAWTSPLARALDEAEPGDTVELAHGGRTIPVTVLAVDPGEA